MSVKRSLRHLVGTSNGKMTSSWSKNIFHNVKRSSNSGGINAYLKQFHTQNVGQNAQNFTFKARKGMKKMFHRINNRTRG
jgi:hypothetical protein